MTTPTTKAAELPEALRLADAIDYHSKYDLELTGTGIEQQAAAELRRLHALNRVLIDANNSFALAQDRLQAENEALRAQPAGAATPAAPAPGVERDDLAELSMLNRLIDLGAKAAGFHATSSSDDGAKGTAAYVQWQETRAQMGELIRSHFAAAPQPAVTAGALDALTSEQERAIREAYESAGAESYFEARPQIDCIDRRRVFTAGFGRGWDAALAAQREVKP